MGLRLYCVFVDRIKYVSPNFPVDEGERPLRGREELRRRVAFVLANSFTNVRQLGWDSVTSEGDLLRASTSLEADGEDPVLFVVGYSGSALVKVNGSSYFSLDGYHKYVPLVKGANRVEAEFSKYEAFGNVVTPSPGTPYYAERRPTAYRLAIYLMTLLDVAEKSDEELRNDIYELLTRVLSMVPFKGITREQALLALQVSQGLFPAEIVNLPGSYQLPSGDEDLGFRDGGAYNDYSAALEALRGGLSELRSKYGKRGSVWAYGHAHIDAAWLWPFDETKRKVLRTFSVIATLMERYDFRYLQSSSMYYEWVKESDPQLYSRIKELVAKGKWYYSAGYIEFDSNLITGESIARQLLYSQRFFISEFGRPAELLWLPDSFGYSAQLPQIASLSGIKSFATHKVFWNDTDRFPYSAFWWESPDGTRLPAAAVGNGPNGYNGLMVASELIEKWRNWADKDIPMTYSYGWGDGGGGPTEEMLITAKAIDESPLAPSVNVTPPLRVPAGDPRSTWRGELYVETHRGTYTSHTKMKDLMARAEAWLREAELWSAIAGTYDRELFRSLWKVVMKNQFHDVIPGSAIKDVYDSVYKELEEVIEKASSVAAEAARRLAGDGSELIAFNSLPWSRSALLTLSEPVEGAQRAEEGYLVRVTLPAGGCDAVRPAPSQGVKVTADKDGYTLDNGILRVRVDRSGDVLSIYDVESSREALRSKTRLVAYENAPGWADAWDIEKSYRDYQVELDVREEARVVEEGPLRATVKAVRGFLNSSVEVRVSLVSGERLVRITLKPKMKDREYMVKLWVPADVNADRATYDIPFGVIERPTTSNTPWEAAKFEVPALRWADVSEDDYGVSVIAVTRHGFSANGSELGVTVARTPIFPDPTTDSESADTLIAIYPHRGDWRSAGTHRVAAELATPVVVVRGGSRCRGPLFSLEPEGLLLEAVKVAEDDDSLIFRVYNVFNRRGSGTLRLWDTPRSAQAVNILESEPIKKNVSVSGNSVVFDFKNYEIVTLKVSVPFRK